ncbi:MAG: hypothetical protein RIT03_1679 [Bacteroidota bacterium]|jgi:hypothetical protein
MKTINELNARIDNTLYFPHNLPIYEYILMPNVGSDDFELFRNRYIQNNGKNLNEFKTKLEPSPIYAVFKNDKKHLPFLFEPKNEIKPL